MTNNLMIRLGREASMAGGENPANRSLSLSVCTPAASCVVGWQSESFEGGIEYVRADLVAKVKPLVWKDYGDGRQVAVAHGYEYEVGCEGGHFYWYELTTEAIADDPRSPDAAQAAAQADYERRMMAGLELAPVTPQQAARVLLSGTPNPLFDKLKYPLSGEFQFPVRHFDEYGDEIAMSGTVPWTTIKEIIAAALRAIAGEAQAND